MCTKTSSLSYLEPFLTYRLRLSALFLLPLSLFSRHSKVRLARLLNSRLIRRTSAFVRVKSCGDTSQTRSRFLQLDRVTNWLNADRKRSTSSMGSTISWPLLGCTPKPCKVLLTGLDAAGKTSLLYKLKLPREQIITTIPTIGFNVESFRVDAVEYTAWDVGGRDKVRLFRVRVLV